MWWRFSQLTGDCSGSCNEFVELWEECYNIDETTYINLSSNQLTGRTLQV